MYIVDTSVWIDFLRSNKTPQVNRLFMIIKEQIPFGINSVIYQEILQGAASEKDFARLDEYMSSQRFFSSHDPISTSRAAARLYFDARQQGFAIRSSLDCLIAEIAIEHELILLHSDHDFELIQKVRPQLRLE